MRSERLQNLAHPWVSPLVFSHTRAPHLSRMACVWTLPSLVQVHWPGDRALRVPTLSHLTRGVFETQR